MSYRIAEIIRSYYRHKGYKLAKSPVSIEESQFYPDKVTLELFFRKSLTEAETYAIIDKLIEVGLVEKEDTNEI
jgi:hypothetical protein